MPPVVSRRAFLGTLAVPAVAAPTVPAFLLGSYQLPNVANAWAEAKQAGLHVIRAAPDEAAKGGLSAWVAVGSDPAKIRDQVTRLKGHTSLLFWETEDEPSYQYKKLGPRVTAERMIAAYRLVKSLDPGRPVYVNHSPTNLVSTLRQYTAGADIFGTDIYPVAPRGFREQYALWPDGLHGDLSNPYVSQVGQYADKLRDAAGPGKRFFMVLQAFAWEALRKPGDRNPKLIQYPTRAELWFMSLQSIVHGASGLVFWGLHTVPSDAPLWPDLKAVVSELRSMEADLAEPSRPFEQTIEYHDLGHTIDRGIECARRGKLTIAVNADRWPVEATLGGRRFSFAPFEARILR